MIWKTRSRLAAWLSVLLLVSLACSLPASWMPQAAPPAATQTPVPPTQTPLPPEVLPPALAEVSPPENSEVALNGEFILYFNQPMERASVNPALNSTPALDWEFNWLDDSTLRLQPSAPLPVSSQIQIQVDASARSASGVALQQALVLNYHTGASLKVLDVLPEPDAVDVNPGAAVAVTFNRPVVALGAAPDDMPAGFSLQPPSKGRGEWLNTSTYIFYPDPPFSGGETFSAAVNTRLTAADGAPLAAEDGQTLTWSFTIASPQLTQISPDPAMPIALDAPIVLTFNQAMDIQSVESALAFLSPQDQPVEMAFSWNDAATEATLTPAGLLERSAAYSLKLGAEARGRGGSSLGVEIFYVYTTMDEFAVASTNPEQGESVDVTYGYKQIDFNFTSPLKDMDFSEMVTVEPQVDDLHVFTSYDRMTLYVNGTFSNAPEYLIRLSTGIHDRWDMHLAEPFTLGFKIAPARPNLAFLPLGGGADVIYFMPGDTTLPARATNIRSVRAASVKLNTAQFLNLNFSQELLRNFIPKEAQYWEQPIKLEADRNTLTNLNISEDGKPLMPGLYFFQMTSPDLPESFTADRFLAVVSGTNLVLKRSASQAFLWAVDIASNQPLGSLPIALYNDQGMAIASCTTDAAGICTTDLSSDDSNEPLMAVASSPEDPRFGINISSWTSGVAGWSFGLNTYTYGVSDKNYVYTDRPLYRPGDTLYMRVVSRQADNGRYSKSSYDSVTLKIIGEYSTLLGGTPTLARIPVPLGEFGTGSAEFTLPADAEPGNYHIETEEGEFTYRSFQVATYRKPEIDLSVKFNTDRALPGKDLTATVQTRYYFGAPAGDINIRWSLYSRYGWFYLPNGYDTGKQDFGFMRDLSGYSYELGRYLKDGTLKTGVDGTAEIRIPAESLPESFDPELFQHMNIEVSIEDDRYLWQSARAEPVPYYPSDFAIGIRPDAWSISATTPLGFSVATVDWQKQISPNHKLTALFQRVNWKQAGGSFMEYASLVPEYETVSSADLQTDSQGQARLAFTPPRPGTYRLEIRGGNAVTQTALWVSGKGAPSWPNLPNQHLALEADASEYEAGQQAHVFIPNPYEGEALALITIERGRVMSSQVVTLDAPSYEFILPLTEEFAPNVYLSITLLGKNASGLPDFRQGYLTLTVKPTAQTLQVDMFPEPAPAAPGQSVAYTLKVRDSSGNPVQGEFSLGLVDKAIYALAEPGEPSITDFFYSKQALGVMNSLSLATYAARMVPAPAGGKGGGGGGSIPPSVRDNFRDTAYWNGQIVTGADGTARVEFPLPDNLTTWVATLRGLTRDTLVGEASGELLSTRPLVILPRTPRFYIAGDRPAFSALVVNNTAAPFDVEVSLQVQGAELQNPASAVQNITLSRGQSQVVSWPALIGSAGAVDLRFTARGGGLEDSATPELNPIPVLRYVAPQTAATHGVIREAGEVLEVVSLPRSFTPSGGELKLEISPSLAAALLKSLKAQETYPTDFTESVLSRFLPNIAVLKALKELGLEGAVDRDLLEKSINDGLARLQRTQNEDGGWGWYPRHDSNTYTSAYVLFGLMQALEAGYPLDARVIEKAQVYLTAALFEPLPETEAWQLDRLTFIHFALAQSGLPQDLSVLADYQERLSPWAQAMLLLSESQLSGIQAGSLVSNLEAGARRSATGAHWEDRSGSRVNASSANFNTAVALLALARNNPTSSLLNEGVRYLMAHRRAEGGWFSSYENAWTILAVIEVLKQSGELQSDYQYSVSLNRSPVLEGSVKAPENLEPRQDAFALEKLDPAKPNSLRIQRTSGPGNLYYRLYLQVERPVESAQPLERGVSITRSYEKRGVDCASSTCTPLDSISLGENQAIKVRLTITVAEEMQFLVVEDSIPAGTEIPNLMLNTTAQGVYPEELYDSTRPYENGWGWWFFGESQIFEDHIRWIGEDVPAGTYTLTYTLQPTFAGTYRAMPAHAYLYYFPEVMGTSNPSQLTITE